MMMAIEAFSHYEAFFLIVCELLNDKLVWENHIKKIEWV